MTHASLRSQLDQLPRPLAFRLSEFGTPMIYSVKADDPTNHDDSMMMHGNDAEQFLRDYFNALPASDKTV